MVLFEVWLFQKTLRIRKRRFFRAGFQNSAVKETGENAVQIILEGVPLCNLSADFIQPEFLIYFLEEEVAGMVFVDMLFT